MVRVSLQVEILCGGTLYLRLGLALQLFSVELPEGSPEEHIRIIRLDLFPGTRRVPIIVDNAAQLSEELWV